MSSPDWNRASIDEPSDDHALTGGHWVQRRGIKVWVGPRPVDDDLELAGMDLTMHRTVEAVMATLAHNLAAPQPPAIAATRVTGVLCDCGCLLINPTETCPACLVWAERDAVRASWLQRRLERDAA